MTTQRQADSNRANAAKSTGPRTSEGKDAAKMNRLAHGLCSTAVLLPGENLDAWFAHREGIMESLAPTGRLETELTERVATIFWRLNRVIRYESAVGTVEAKKLVASLSGAVDPEGYPDTVLGLEARIDNLTTHIRQLEYTIKLLQNLDTLPDDQRIYGMSGSDLLEDIRKSEQPENYDREKFLNEIGVPKNWHESDPFWPDYKVGTVKTGLNAFARLTGRSVAALIARSIERTVLAIADDQKKIAAAREMIPIAEHELVETIELVQDTRILPDKEMAQVVRYEAHLNRQLKQAFDMLERLQKGRLGRRAQLPEPPEPGRSAATTERSQSAPGSEISRPMGLEVVSALRTQPLQDRPDGVPDQSGTVETTDRSQSQTVEERPGQPRSQDRPEITDRSRLSPLLDGVQVSPGTHNATFFAQRSRPDLDGRRSEEFPGSSGS